MALKGDELTVKSNTTYKNQNVKIRQLKKKIIWKEDKLEPKISLKYPLMVEQFLGRKAHMKMS